MIDFVKILLLDISPEVLRCNPLLDFFRSVSTKSGEMRSKDVATYKGLTFIIHESGSIILSGSLHKYWNNGLHNFNDFGVSELIQVLDSLKSLFGISPEQMKINQLEIGVNFTPPYPTEKLLQYCFLHSTVGFVWRYDNDEGKFIQAEHTQYLLKVYDKTRRYKNRGIDVPHAEIMRIEVKYLKTEKIGNGIKTLQDLLEFGIEKYIPEIVAEWNKVLFYDFTIKSSSRTLDKYSNPIYWKNLRSANDKLRTHRKKLRALIDNYSDNIPKQVGDCIKNKGRFLCEKFTVLTNKSETESSGLNHEELHGIDTLNIVSESINYMPNFLSAKWEQVYRYIHGDYTQIDKDKCLMTGLDISMQREESFLLSHTGLKYYLMHEPETYNRIKDEYLTNKWVEESVQIQVKEIAHNIRNKLNNLKISQNIKYPPNSPILF